ncbi:MAG: M23 family metallopeptidase [Bacilli bacterium]|nr:M23 family metallopeptidase [Bacilli bacterium]
MDIEEIRNEIKRNKNKKPLKKNNYTKLVNKFLITVLITVITLIFLKSNNEFKTFFYKNVYDKNFSFSKVNKLYKDLFGSPIPFSDLIEKNKTSLVFDEKLQYKEKFKYLDGVKLTVSKNYLVPTLESGMVVFIGEKENYGNTIIIQQTDGIDVWYSNIKVSSVQLYDYVEKGSLIGETNDNILYLVYKKDGKVLNYEDYI